MFSPLQAGSFDVTGSHGSPSSHSGYAENYYLTLERHLPEIKTISKLPFGRDIQIRISLWRKVIHFFLDIQIYTQLYYFPSWGSLAFNFF